jgi:hypothetical protein
MKESFHSQKSILLRRSDMSLFVWWEARVNRFRWRTQSWWWRTSLGLHLSVETQRIVQRLQILRSWWAYWVSLTRFTSGSRVYGYGVYGGDFGVDAEPLFWWMIFCIYIGVSGRCLYVAR